MEKIRKVVDWAQKTVWTKCQRHRLEYLEAIVAKEAIFSAHRGLGPDDISPFGKPVYLMDMSECELKEYLLSGLSQEEQSALFSS